MSARSIDDAAAYPLSWPLGQPRTPSAERARWRGIGWRDSDLPLGRCLRELGQELERLGANHIVISSDRPVRNDGLPRANARDPEDPGVAVWFELDGQPRVMACDAWRTNSQNVRAITKTIEALRGVERWGACDLSQAFAGYAALPPGAVVEVDPDPWGFFCLEREFATVDDVRAAYRAEAKIAHPDQEGGSSERMAMVTRLRDRALEELEG